LGGTISRGWELGQQRRECSGRFKHQDSGQIPQRNGFSETHRRARCGSGSLGEETPAAAASLHLFHVLAVAAHGWGGGPPGDWTRPSTPPLCGRLLPLQLGAINKFLEKSTFMLRARHSDRVADPRHCPMVAVEHSPLDHESRRGPNARASESRPVIPP
jgi:hypothetical protein